MHCVDLDESFPTSIYLQNLASIQPRTSPKKFGKTGKRDFEISFAFTPVRAFEIGGQWTGSSNDDINTIHSTRVCCPFERQNSHAMLCLCNLFHKKNQSCVIRLCTSSQPGSIETRTAPKTLKQYPASLRGKNLQNGERPLGNSFNTHAKHMISTILKYTKRS